MSVSGFRAGAADVAFTLLAASYRWHSLEGSEGLEALCRDPTSVIVSFWHSRVIGGSHYVQRRLHSRGLPAHVLVSRSTDGEIISRWIKRQGGTTSRGSSTRGGGAALRDLVRTVKRRDVVVVTTPDGPRGPDRRVQPGTILLAQMAGIPVYPISCAARRSWRLRSWDRFMIPKPFTRLSLVVGEPLSVPREADEAGRERYRLELERSIRAADERAAEILGVAV